MREKNLDLLHVSLEGHDDICKMVEAWEATCEGAANTAAMFSSILAVGAAIVAVNELLPATELITLPPGVPFYEMGHMPILTVTAVVILQTMPLWGTRRLGLGRVFKVVGGILVLTLSLTAVANYYMRDIPLTASLSVMVLSCLWVIAVAIGTHKPLKRFGRIAAAAVLKPSAWFKNKKLARQHPQWKGVVDFKTDGSCVGSLANSRFVLSPSQRCVPEREIDFVAYQAQRTRIAFPETAG